LKKFFRITTEQLGFDSDTDSDTDTEQGILFAIAIGIASKSLIPPLSLDFR